MLLAPILHFFVLKKGSDRNIVTLPVENNKNVVKNKGFGCYDETFF